MTHCPPDPTVIDLGARSRNPWHRAGRRRCEPDPASPHRGGDTETRRSRGDRIDRTREPGDLARSRSRGSQRLRGPARELEGRGAWTLELRTRPPHRELLAPAATKLFCAEPPLAPQLLPDLLVRNAAAFIQLSGPLLDLRDHVEVVQDLLECAFIRESIEEGTHGFLRFQDCPLFRNETRTLALCHRVQIARQAGKRARGAKQRNPRLARRRSEGADRQSTHLRGRREQQAGQCREATQPARSEPQANGARKRLGAGRVAPAGAGARA